MKYRFSIGSLITDDKYSVEIIDITDTGYIVTSEELQSETPYVGVRYIIPFTEEKQYNLIEQ